MCCVKYTEERQHFNFTNQTEEKMHKPVYLRCSSLLSKHLLTFLTVASYCCHERSVSLSLDSCFNFFLYIPIQSWLENRKSIALINYYTVSVGELSCTTLQSGVSLSLIHCFQFGFPAVSRENALHCPLLSLPRLAPRQLKSFHNEWQGTIIAFRLP